MCLLLWPLWFGVRTLAARMGNGTTNAPEYVVPAVLRGGMFVPRQAPGRREPARVTSGAFIAAGLPVPEHRAQRNVYQLTRRRGLPWTPGLDGHIRRRGGELLGRGELILIDIDTPATVDGTPLTDALRWLADQAVQAGGMVDLSATVSVRTPGHPDSGHLPGWHLWYRADPACPVRMGPLMRFHAVELRTRGTCPGSPGYVVWSAPPVFSLDLAQTATGGYVPGQISAQAAADYAAYAAALTNPAWQGIFEPVPLLDARNAGVLGVVVAWTGVPDDEAANQYNPFTTSYPAASGLPSPGDAGCPAVWVGDSAGTELATLAAGGQASATLVLTADITAGAATETVWGWLEGSGNTARTSSSTPTPTGRTPPRRTAGSGSSRWPGTWRPCPRATATCISRWSRGISSCRSSAAPS